MYEELLIGLRGHAKRGGCDDRCPCYGAQNRGYLTCSEELAEKGADAIETMREMVATAHDELANVIQNYEESKPRWIPVTERLPEGGTRVLVMRFDFVTNTPFYDLLWFDKGEWWNRRFAGDYAVTHWMPLPEPPKEEA